MSGAILREAAALMRERASDATSESGASDWWAAPCFDEWRVRSSGGLVCAETYEGEARHIASWNPAVALAVADLLELAAVHEKRTGDQAGQGYGNHRYGYIDPSCSACGTPDEYAEPWPCEYAKRGLAVARAYLGRDA